MAEFLNSVTVTKYKFEFTEQELQDLVDAVTGLTSVRLRTLHRELQAPLNVAVPSDRIGE